jgi:hypothetical protein
VLAVADAVILVFESNIFSLCFAVETAFRGVEGSDCYWSLFLYRGVNLLTLSLIHSPRLWLCPFHSATLDWTDSYASICILGSESYRTDDLKSRQSPLWLDCQRDFKLSIYRQSVRLGVVPCVTFSLTTIWVFHLWIGFTFVKCTYSTYSMLLSTLSCALYTSPMSAQALHSRSCLSYLSYTTTA